MIDNKVKLIIWGLDDTFWRGTLEEGGIEPIPENIRLVRELAQRGIVSSICSKNNYEHARAKLTELGVWDDFVFPAISFEPKGRLVREMIESAGLRPKNVLFLDDNSMNLEEMRFVNRQVMSVHPADVLHLLRDHPQLTGKPDPALNRLRQYRELPPKIDDRKTAAHANEDFLRARMITIEMDYDVAGHFDRVVELINRAHQLNYTKKRLETAEQVEELRDQLNGFGYHAGCIHAADKYGNYGLIGFYLLRRRSSVNRLVHFVFSRSAMHMGIEQYVYEMLGRPDLDVVPHVAYGLDGHGSADWIQAKDADRDAAAGTISNKVKLVIWDLDDTFWRGTLEEGGIEPIPENVALVRELAQRGIVSSICSKNNLERARAKLIELGVWDCFVFPAISFEPKGQVVASMIEEAGLRAKNVLVLDDNPMNLEEIRYFSRQIMAADPGEVLHLLRDHPHLAGKPDPDLTRLNQYRVLERKSEDRKTTTLSNDDFLRASDIHIDVDDDVEGNFDRVLELINRTNQLNYTKKRLETPQEVEELRGQLGGFGYEAGCIRAADRYGDYGLIGFYLLRRFGGRRLFHFVFSCRAMHMGIEQYVYEMLGRPDLDIVQPVAYGLDTNDSIDWIQIGGIARAAQEEAVAGSRKLLLLGGCDLLQMTSYCSNDRLEFVNRNEGKFRIRYDDPGFILSDRAVIRRNEIIREIPIWTYDDAVRFDEGLASSELVVVSLWPGMNGKYYEVTDGLRVRMAAPDAQRVRKCNPKWFRANFRELHLTDEEKLGLVSRSLDAIREKVAGGRVFLMGCCTLGVPDQNNVDRRSIYNAACRNYCDNHPALFQYVDVDAIVAPEWVVGTGHFTRVTYHALAQHILAGAASPGAAKSGGAAAKDLRTAEAA